MTSRSGSSGTAKPSRSERSGPALVEKGSGNVFIDLGFPKAVAENLQLRSNLMIQLRNHLDFLQLTQAQSAELLGVTQPRISDLTRGKIDRFSVDTLITMLVQAGKRVSVIVR